MSINPFDLKLCIERQLEHIMENKSNIERDMRLNGTDLTKMKMWVDCNNDWVEWTYTYRHSLLVKDDFDIDISDLFDYIIEFGECCSRLANEYNEKIHQDLEEKLSEYNKTGQTSDQVNTVPSKVKVINQMVNDVEETRQALGAQFEKLYDSYSKAQANAQTAPEQSSDSATEEVEDAELIKFMEDTIAEKLIEMRQLREKYLVCARAYFIEALSSDETDFNTISEGELREKAEAEIESLHRIALLHKSLLELFTAYLEERHTSSLVSEGVLRILVILEKVYVGCYFITI